MPPVSYADNVSYWPVSSVGVMFTTSSLLNPDGAGGGELVTFTITTFEDKDTPFVEIMTSVSPRPGTLTLVGAELDTLRVELNTITGRVTGIVVVPGTVVVGTVVE